jgi:ABC-type amino acid transport substrate-binding protein
MDAATTAALVAEAAKRSGVLWVRRVGDGSDPTAAPLAVWHVWDDGSAYLLTGGSEQPAPQGLDADAAQAEVIARSKDKGSRLVVWRADVHRVEPEGDEWRRLLPALAARRLNAPDGEQAPQRWARECRLLRLTPVEDAAAG